MSCYKIIETPQLYIVGSASQSFAGAALGSIGAGGFGYSVGKEFADNTAGTLLFGTVAGGAGAELAGGNFWEGAVVGFTVALLNHTMHKMGERFAIDDSLEDAGYSPGAKATETAEYATDMADRVSDLRGIRDASLTDGSQTLKGRDLNVSIINSGDNNTTPKGNISLNRNVFVTNRRLALAMGHEMIHRAHHLLGIFNQWKGLINASNTNQNFYALHLSEGWAYRWTERMSSLDFFSNGQTASWHFNQASNLLNSYK